MDGRVGSRVMLTRMLSGLVLGTVLASAAAAGGQQASGSASVPPRDLAGGAMIVAQNNSCASACQAAHNRCRVETKGSPKCDEERQRCLQGCIAGKRR